MLKSVLLQTFYGPLDFDGNQHIPIMEMMEWCYVHHLCIMKSKNYNNYYNHLMALCVGLPG